jgi:8-oxo-dGTP pyrophosphatase MutT (NUDIX family)
MNTQSNTQNAGAQAPLSSPEACAAARLSEALRAQLAAQVAAFPRWEHAVDDHHHAAVALTLVEEGFGAELPGLPRLPAPSRAPALLLTRRALTLRRHAGQWALPGGRLDPGETPEETALRELEEEVGLTLPPSAVLGCLDDFTTRSGFVMTPVVLWGGAADALVPSPAEVASIHRIPLAEFVREDAPRLEPPHDPGGPPVLRMPVGRSDIAAPTAALIYQFRELLCFNRVTRVAHFDQPRFAWR